jgi:hypothetical protein
LKALQDRWDYKTGTADSQAKEDSEVIRRIPAADSRSASVRPIFEFQAAELFFKHFSDVIGKLRFARDLARN